MPTFPDFRNCSDNFQNERGIFFFFFTIWPISTANTPMKHRNNSVEIYENTLWSMLPEHTIPHWKTKKLHTVGGGTQWLPHPLSAGTRFSGNLECSLWHLKCALKLPNNEIAHYLELTRLNFRKKMWPDWRPLFQRAGSCSHSCAVPAANNLPRRSSIMRCWSQMSHAVITCPLVMDAGSRIVNFIVNFIRDGTVFT